MACIASCGLGGLPPGLGQLGWCARFARWVPAMREGFSLLCKLAFGRLCRLDLANWGGERALRVGFPQGGRGLACVASYGLGGLPPGLGQLGWCARFARRGSRYAGSV
ncbi:MAG TPA: hypothetical protein ENJ82_01870 [Bacteroidetes bacterium]|nr:hypothetical protein [Bacteroidota bacterium]